MTTAGWTILSRSLPGEYGGALLELLGGQEVFSSGDRPHRPGNQFTQQGGD